MVTASFLSTDLIGMKMAIYKDYQITKLKSLNAHEKVS